MHQLSCAKIIMGAGVCDFFAHTIYRGLYVAGKF